MTRLKILLDKLQKVLQIQRGELLLVLTLSSLFFFWEAGRELGSQTATTLYISRVGTQTLPLLYIGLGLGNILISTLYSFGFAYFRPRRYYLAIVALFAAFLIAQYLFTSGQLSENTIRLPLSLALLWLTVFVGSNLIATLQWSIAGKSLDTRQAKRLFSLLASAGFVGAIAAATLARPLSNYYRDNISTLFLWQVGCILLGFLVLRSHYKTLPVSEDEIERPKILAGLKSGASAVSQSPLLRQVSVSLILFSILYLSIDLLYNSVVNQSFTLESEKLNYLATVSATVQILTLLISIFLTGRLIKRFGVVNANFFLVAAYGIAFGLLLFDPSLLNISLARVLQLTTLGGIVQSSNYIFFNVIPAERRAQALSFTFGVVGQVGIIFSGMLLMVGNRLSMQSAVAIIGLVLTVAVGWVTLSMRRGYRLALLGALKSGRLDVFSVDANQNSSFNSLETDPATIRLLTNSLSDTQPLTRRLGIEILAEMGIESSLSDILARMADTDAGVRQAAFSALQKLNYKNTGRWAAEALHDPAAEVRLQALQYLAQVAPSFEQLSETHIKSLMQEDDLTIRLQAIKVFALSFNQKSATSALHKLLKRRSELERAEAIKTLGEIASILTARGQLMYRLLAPKDLRALLKDPSPIVRRETCLAIQWFEPQVFKKEIIALLSDPNQSVREAAASVMRSQAIGQDELLSILSTSEDSDLLETAMLALPPSKELLLEPVLQFAAREINALALWRQRAAALRMSGRAANLLLEVIKAEIQRIEIRLLLALKIIEPEDNLEWDYAIDSLRSGNPERRTAILETLDTLGDTTLAKELILPALEEAAQAEGYREDETFLNPAAALRELLENGDRWMRALAMTAAAETSSHSLTADIAKFTRARDPLVRETAKHTLQQLKKGPQMSQKTLQLLSSVERIILLREVPLFKTLEINDLKQLAELAREQLFQENEFVVKQGDRGDQLYIIASGEVEIWLNTGNQEEQVALGKSGDFFGEMAVLETAPRSASIRARTPVRALVIDGNAFKAILRDRPEVALTVLRGLSQRIRRANELLSDPKYKSS